jgi:Ca2+-binding EF-hand superfamily protein
VSRSTSLFLFAFSLFGTIAAAHAHDGPHPPKVEKTGQAIKSSEFITLDSNKDGNLSKAELAKHKLGPHFDMLDTDKDGRLSVAEFAAGKGM